MTCCFPRLLAGSVLAVAVSLAWAGARPDGRTGELRAGTVPTPAAAGEKPDDSGPLRFDISRYAVQGNTLLEPAQVDAILAPHAGAGRDFGDIQRALEALEAAYHARGYKVVTIRLPEQELDGGVVVLRVVETRLGRVSVRHNRHFDEANVRRSLPTLVPGRVPDVDAISANLKQANENPSRQLALTLKAGETDDEIDALLDVRDSSPWRVLANVDNTGSAQTGRSRVGMGLQHANLFGRDHLVSLQYITSAEEPGRVKVYGAGYHIPFYDSGNALDLYASYSNVDSGTVSAGAFDLGVSGKGAVYGMRYSQSLGRGSYESALNYGIDIKSFRNSVLLFGTQLGNDITVHTVSLGYQGLLALAGGQAAGQVTVVRNVSGGARGAQEDFTLVRTGAKDDYTLLRLGASITRAVGDDWQLRAIANGQYTRDALVPGEQFGAGGGGSVRGYVEREIANDSGLAVNLEAYTPNLCGRPGWNCRLLGFYDAARVRRNHALAREIDRATIASAGLGMRLALDSRVNLQLDYGHALRSGAGAITRAHDNRLHLRLGIAY